MDAAVRQRLRDAIKRTGRTQGDLALSAGIAPETLSRVLSGRHEAPRLETVAYIAQAVGVSVGWLLGEEEFRIGASERAELRRAAHLILNLIAEARS